MNTTAGRHQAVSGYWHTQATLARWCRIRSYLDSAAAHGLTALEAVTAALAGKPWLPPLPVAEPAAAFDPDKPTVRESPIVPVRHRTLPG